MRRAGHTFNGQALQLESSQFHTCNHTSLYTTAIVVIRTWLV